MRASVSMGSRRCCRIESLDVASDRVTRDRDYPVQNPGVRLLRHARSDQSREERDRNRIEGDGRWPVVSRWSRKFRRASLTTPGCRPPAPLSVLSSVGSLPQFFFKKTIYIYCTPRTLYTVEIYDLSKNYKKSLIERSKFSISLNYLFFQDTIFILFWRQP
jgi:hypothetical protein